MAVRFLLLVHHWDQGGFLSLFWDAGDVIALWHRIQTEMLWVCRGDLIFNLPFSAAAQKCLLRSPVEFARACLSDWSPACLTPTSHRALMVTGSLSIPVARSDCDSTVMF